MMHAIIQQFFWCFGSTNGGALHWRSDLSGSYGGQRILDAQVAMRVSLPEANSSIYLTASLGITFPFNIAFGIPVYP
ncbi:MAG: sodium-dependent bicarbonate transport family permease [Nitrospinota bacterium]